MQTLARPITAEFPQETYAILKRRAKAEKMTLAQTVVALIEDALDEMSDEEDKRFSAICDERRRNSTGKYLTHEEFWKLAEDVPYNPEG